MLCLPCCTLWNYTSNIKYGTTVHNCWTENILLNGYCDLLYALFSPNVLQCSIWLRSIETLLLLIQKWNLLLEELFHVKVPVWSRSTTNATTWLLAARNSRLVHSMPQGISQLRVSPLQGAVGQLKKPPLLSPFQMEIYFDNQFGAIQILKISITTKLTFSKSHFWQNSHF